MAVKPLLWPSLATVLAMIALTGLGLWQLQRLQWKLGLIQRIAERVHAAPIQLETAIAQAAAGAPADFDYTHIRATGHFRNDLERYLYANGPSDWGWDVLTPLELVDGRAVIVNRGFVPRQQLDRSLRAAGLADGVVTLTGLVRSAPAARPWSIPAGDPVKFTWYWFEIGAIAASMYPTRGAPITTFYVDADPIAAAAPPAGGATNLDLPNRHLEYAFTWFGLAAVLAVIYGLFAFRQVTGSRG